MSSAPIVVSEPQNSRDNEVRPFQIEGRDVRGRAVRLGTMVDRVLSVQDYPEPVAKILGEMTALAALLGSILKYEGVVTIQTKSTGPVPMMVADYTSQGEAPGKIRAYAQIDEAKYSHYGKNPSFHGLIGSKTGSYLAITIDQGEHMERFQGIVELEGDSLSDVAVNYFHNSEQTPTAMRLVADRDTVTGNWRAGGIMVQHLARGEEGRERILERHVEEEWERARILMESVKTEELLNPALDLDQLLFRLYHEDGVRVFEPNHVEFGCRCSRDKIETAISGFPKEDIDHMTVDGKVSVDCHFCGTVYDFDPQHFLEGKE